MLAMSKPLWKVAGAGAVGVALCLAGCSGSFLTKVGGSLRDGVSFHFYLPEDKLRPAKLNVVNFVVQERKGDDEWAVVWRLEGKQSLEAVTYAARYEGLREVSAAIPLSQGARYRVLVSEEPSFGAPRSSEGHFYIDESGAAVQTGPS
jgi:hypothetical protein